MSIRGTLRRRMVLPVSVFRGQEKQLAHTLDVTENSSRLAGLLTLPEPGEIIEIARGAVKAKFEVLWVGAPGTALFGQAGVRGVETNKVIWGVNLPADEPDGTLYPARYRSGSSSVRMMERENDLVEKRAHQRVDCCGGASLWPKGSTYPIHTQMKDISRGGVYVQSTTALPLGTEVQLRMNVQGILVETSGAISTSHPLVGMGIAFRGITPEQQQNLDLALQALREAPLPNIDGNAAESGAVYHTAESHLISSSRDLHTITGLIYACRTLTAGFDQWRSSFSPEQMEAFRQAISELQDRLALDAFEEMTVPEPAFSDVVSSCV